jgi:hypothetical protein
VPPAPKQFVDELRFVIPSDAGWLRGGCLRLSAEIELRARWFQVLTSARNFSREAVFMRLPIHGASAVVDSNVLEAVAF